MCGFRINIIRPIDIDTDINISLISTARQNFIMRMLFTDM